MDILFLTNIPSPYRVDFFSELWKREKITVLYERQSASDRDASWGKVDGTSYESVYLPSLSLGSDSSISIGHLKYLNNGKYDFFVIMGYSTPVQMIGIIHCILHRIPYTIVIDGAIERNDHRSLSGRIKRFLISRAQAILCTGSVSRRVMESYGANSKGIHVVPFTSIHKNDVLASLPSEQTVAELRKELELCNCFTFISVGQFIHRKGFDILIEAAAKVGREIQVLIVGGVPSSEYTDLKKKYNLEKLQFIGFQDKETLRKYYMASDVYVMPTREDVWGLVINEAMACGLPIISTDACVAAMELVKKENGSIIPSENADALAYAMRTFCDMTTEEILEIRKNNLQISRSITIETMAEAYRNAFQTILRGRERKDG